MAKIKRFYLFIAALVFSRPYAALAYDVNCTSITNLSSAQSCYNNWVQKYESGSLTYGAWKAAGFDGSDYHTCYMWSPDYVDGNEDQYASWATCQELYYDELAGYCCQYSYTSDFYTCTEVLQGNATCNSSGGNGSGSAVYWDCSDEQVNETVTEYSMALEKAQQFDSNYGCFTEWDLVQEGFDAEVACNYWDGASCDDGNAYDEEGNLKSCAECCNVDVQNLEWQACQTTTNPGQCIDWRNGDIQCSEGLPSCAEGEYWAGSDGVCRPCPEYEFDDGSYDSFATSLEGAMSKNSCFIPRDYQLWDESGDFSFVSNCFYSGS